MQIGAQFYTLRSFCQTTEGLEESLKRVADIGYRTVQLSGVCAYDAAWMKEQLRRNGLRCVLTHNPVPKLTESLEQTIADHHTMDCKYIGLGHWAFDPERGQSYEDFLRIFPETGRRIREAGCYFMYHNHDGEFKKAANGRLMLENLREDMPADVMGFTLDTFWVQAGGGDPAQWLEKLAGRIPCIHLKDYAYGRSMAVVGEGNINFDRVFEKAEAGGTEYMLVEQDDCHGEDPFDCLARSYAYLRSRGFE